MMSGAFGLRCKIMSKSSRTRKVVDWKPLLVHWFNLFSVSHCSQARPGGVGNQRSQTQAKRILLVPSSFVCAAFQLARSRNSPIRSRSSHWRKSLRAHALRDLECRDHTPFDLLAGLDCSFSNQRTSVVTATQTASYPGQTNKV
jgi:hypothetical protein